MDNYRVTANETAQRVLSGLDTLTVEENISLTVSAAAVQFNDATTGGIYNLGSIVSTADRGINGAIETGFSFPPSGQFTIVNYEGASIRGNEDAIKFAASGTSGGRFSLFNDATIAGGLGQGLDFKDVTGSIVLFVQNGSTGQITSSTNDAIRFGASGTLDNFGAIAGRNDGFKAEAGTVVAFTNAASASIVGHNGAGFGSDGSATVLNEGTITGENNAGNADGDGVDIDYAAIVTNSGRIAGTGAGGAGNTSEGVAAGGGTIDNQLTGVITGATHGILIDDGNQGAGYFVTSIKNAGTISGATNAIRLVGAFSDSVSNDGTITALSPGATAILFGSGSNILEIKAHSTIVGLSDGGAGSDLLDYHLLGTGVVVNLTLGTATKTGGVLNFEDVLGTSVADSFTTGLGANTFIGGAGNDTYHLGADTADTVVEAADGAQGGLGDTLTSTIGRSLAAFTGIENLTLLGSGAINGQGNSQNNQLDGSQNSAANILAGGNGDDIYILGMGDTANETGATGTDTVRAHASFALGANLEALILLGAATDGIGNAQDNTITGNGLNNTLDGKGGLDKLIGGLGDDTYVLGAEDDTVSDAGGLGDAITSTISRSLDDYAGIEQLVLLGSATSATGNEGKNVLFGNGANNVLDGLGGGDSLIGGDGNDTYVVHAGDVITELKTALSGIDTVRSGQSYTLGSNLENLALTSRLIKGISFATGNALDNTIVGNRQDNVITGGKGMDILSGKQGDDSFLFLRIAPANARLKAETDVITDFNAFGDHDRINLKAMDAKAIVRGSHVVYGRDDAFKLLDEGDRFTKKAGELRFSLTTDENKHKITLIQGDINGDRKADFAIELTGWHHLDKGDFIL